MHCPFCGKTVTAVPKDYPILEGRTIQIKVYKCIRCDFEWTPISERYRIARLKETVNKP